MRKEIIVATKKYKENSLSRFLIINFIFVQNSLYISFINIVVLTRKFTTEGISRLMNEPNV
jgi:hypothetical protein